MLFPNTQTIVFIKGVLDNLQQFLKLTDRPILKDKGRISMLEAQLKAETEYKKFRVKQDKMFNNDFDREVKKLISKNRKIK